MTLEQIMLEKIEEIIRRYRAGEITTRVAEISVASEVLEMQRLRYKREH
jgi:hypothetical protein